MNRAPKPLQVSVYQDVLCAWCHIANERLLPIRKEFGAAVQWRVRPYPLRIREGIPKSLELASWKRELEKARAEPEGQHLSTEIWDSGDPPRSSISALVAVEAARLQGDELAWEISRLFRKAALERGLNVTRPDVAIELAASLGLNMNRFIAAYGSPQSRRLVLQEHRLAAKRGVKNVPCLVINGRWMLSGLKDADEYRQQILRCMEKAVRSSEGAHGHSLH
jgi:predicted DsbA family dithiol-disulfide isomerase